VVRDLKLGSGAAAKEGDELWVHYAGLNYRTREEFETSWILTFKFELGGGTANEGWERGLVGMRVGGRRELIVPPRLAFGSDTLVYLVDLTAVR
jgi:peptidylprolyl isomerase